MIRYITDANVLETQLFRVCFLKISFLKKSRICISLRLFPTFPCKNIPEKLQNIGSLDMNVSYKRLVRAKQTSFPIIIPKGEPTSCECPCVENVFTT